MGDFTHYNGAGQLIETIVDHGDGTGTRTTYVDGEPAGTETVALPVEPGPGPLELIGAALAGQPPEVVARLAEVIALGASLVDRAGDLTAAVADEDALAGITVVAEAVTDATA